MTASARRSARSAPTAARSVFWFDKDGNVSKQSAFAVTNYTYDALDRLLTRTYPADSTLNVSLTYDQTTGHGSGVGHLTSLTDQAGSLEPVLRAARPCHQQRPHHQQQRLHDRLHLRERRASRLASPMQVRGWIVTYARDSAGQVTSITDKPPSTAPVNLATSITHMPFGPVASLHLRQRRHGRAHLRPRLPHDER